MAIREKSSDHNNIDDIVRFSLAGESGERFIVNWWIDDSYEIQLANIALGLIVIFSKFSWHIDFDSMINCDYNIDEWGHNKSDHSHIFIRHTGEYVYINNGMGKHLFRPYDIISEMYSISQRFNIKLINEYDSFSVDTHEFKQDGTEIIKQEG